jgi:uncharacterized membrane protein YeaQ/YmgE (transglycosylase-associated protein family)
MIVVGLIVGVVAKLLMPGKDPGGWIVTILLGIGGSVVAQFLTPLIDWHPTGLLRHVASVGGAMLILLAYRLLVRRGRF